MDSDKLSQPFYSQFRRCWLFDSPVIPYVGPCLPLHCIFQVENDQTHGYIHGPSLHCFRYHLRRIGRMLVRLSHQSVKSKKEKQNQRIKHYRGYLQIYMHNLFSLDPVSSHFGPDLYIYDPTLIAQCTCEDLLKKNCFSFAPFRFSGFQILQT